MRDPSGPFWTLGQLGGSFRRPIACSGAAGRTHRRVLGLGYDNVDVHALETIRGRMEMHDTGAVARVGTRPTRLPGAYVARIDDGDSALLAVESVVTRAP